MMQLILGSWIYRFGTSFLSLSKSFISTTEKLPYPPQSFFCLFDKYLRYGCTPKRVTVFERGGRLSGRSEVTLGVTTSCCSFVLSGSLATKLARHYVPSFESSFYCIYGIIDYLLLFKTYQIYLYMVLGLSSYCWSLHMFIYIKKEVD